MNSLKFGILLCGLVGLAGVFLPLHSAGEHSYSLWYSHSASATEGGGFHVYLVMGGYALALVMGVLAVTAPPMQRWHAFVALIGFGLVLVKMRQGLPVDIFKQEIGGKLMGAASYLGALVSVLALANPETAS